ncbi:YqcC family protein [Plesiomonas shigelloides]|uniref:YqcC-like domain-containing protein n=2 Tax=Plesiomonas shigelloides TaxID=703 RepID=R8AN70_PLESH|nr:MULTISPECIES: YqcC family protein [Plesiomonas]MDO4688682.1 YqcC family protein [Plesiomonas sp.]AVQ88344.1 YqcC family protein [Plesiomonas shigelloides]EON87755.1 hypothetical protein PLESHI_14056 [Plesiomonas shigelloides 302-73]KAB7662363.1 YqcC family protein [Plesiomonas shigelloides]KAB7673469.1 YqcC family protein [Plesiomonas shigelloides]
MEREQQVRQLLEDIRLVMMELALWQKLPPEPQAFQSVEPFSIDTMEAQEWLQWVFLPRMHALLDAGAGLPTRFSITPYFEEALKEQEQISRLLAPLRALDELLNQET